CLESLLKTSKASETERSFASHNGQECMDGRFLSCVNSSNTRGKEKGLKWLLLIHAIPVGLVRLAVIARKRTVKSSVNLFAKYVNFQSMRMSTRLKPFVH